MTDNLDEVKLDLNKTITTHANQTCKDHPLCAHSYCKMIKRERGVQYREERTWGVFEGGKPKVTGDPNGWVCSNNVINLVCWGNRWYRYRTRSEPYTEKDPRCKRLISEVYQLMSIDSVEMELNDVQDQCEESTQDNTQIISCKGIQLNADWTLSKSEGDLSEDVSYRSNYRIDLDFKIKN